MESNANQTERNNYESELSVGTYTGKKIYELVVSVGSSALGAWGGLAAAGKYMKPGTVEQVSLLDNTVSEVAESAKELPGFIGKLPGLRGAFSSRQLMWGAGGGVFAGGIIGGLVLGYEHWQKVKREQLQVDEITKDVSDIEVFKKTDPELKAENERLWTELNKREPKPNHSAHHARREHASHAEAVREQQAEQAMAELER